MATQVPVIYDKALPESAKFPAVGQLQFPWVELTMSYLQGVDASNT